MISGTRIGRSSLSFLILIIFTLRAVVGKQNILLIVVDDLRPSLACYGDAKAYTPNIDLLAKRSVLFTRAYAQQSLCAPSRNSLLTSRRPDTLKLYDFYSYWRDKVGNFTTLPEHLKNNGYITMSIGKVFHPGRSSNGSDDFPYSWSEEPFHPFTNRYKDAPLCRSPSDSEPSRNIVCPVRVSHMPNKTLPDMETLTAAKSFIHKRHGDRKPFFLAVGFQKPHIPLKYPKKYLKHHPLEKFNEPDNYRWPANVSSVAYNPWTDLRERADIKKFRLKFPYGKIPPEYARLIIQSYYAAVTYIDDLIGLLMKQLAAHNIERRTAIILISDHGTAISRPRLHLYSCAIVARGWALGEHGEWAKYSNFEVALRVPVMVSVPRLTYDPPLGSYYAGEKNFLKSARSGLILHSSKHPKTQKEHVAVDSMIELVDIFPTIADLANLPIPMCPDREGNRYNDVRLLELRNPCSEGISFLPVIRAAMIRKSIPWKTGVFSQYPRPGIVPTRIPNSDKPRLNDINIMGYTIRTTEYRYTAWLPFDHITERANWNVTVAEELYNHDEDAEENYNLATREEFHRIKIELNMRLKSGWRNALPGRYQSSRESV